MKKNKAISIKYLMYDIIRLTAIPGWLWFRPKKYYPHPEDKKHIKGGALIISNHITLFDPMYLMLSITSRRHHFICMDELCKKGFSRWLYTKCFLCIPISRENVTIEQIKSIIFHLKNGDLVSMFPEGKINGEDDNVRTFKNGMVMMAMRSGVPIIPVYIKRRKHFYSRLEVAIGSPFDVTKFKSGASATKEETNQATLALHEKEKELEVFMLNRGKK